MIRSVEEKMRGQEEKRIKERERCTKITKTKHRQKLETHTDVEIETDETEQHPTLIPVKAG